MLASTPQEALVEYGKATNTHVFANVSELISEDAVYYFSDETVIGHDQLKHYFEKTWDYIRDEVYAIDHVNWVAIDETIAVCIYRFHWKGSVEGEHKEGYGRGTNVFKLINGSWKIVHEHLSTLD